MRVTTFSSLKGGVGKSSLTIQTANCLGAAGFRVLVIDMDLNNSVSSYYLDDKTKELIGEKNIAAAMSKSTNDLKDYILPTKHKGVQLIASSLYLIDLRGVSERRLAQLAPTLQNEFDVVIIDTQPTYDNLVLNAYTASDLIITPINLSLFDYNTAVFLRDQLATETDKAGNWFLHINGYNRRYGDAKAGSQKEYLDLFRTTFQNLTPPESWIPWTNSLRSVIDREMELALNPGPNRISNPTLFSALKELSECLLDESSTISDGLEAF